MDTNTDLEAYIATAIPQLADALRLKIVQETGNNVSFELLTMWLSDFVKLNEQTNLQLSTTKPDFEQIKVQFISRLRQKDSWRDLIQAGVGETLLEFVAAIGDYGQTSILRAYQETSYDARLTSSVYTITRTLGVHIDRKVPATVSVNLYSEDPSILGDLAIPSFSQFSVGGHPCFNRKTIVFNNNSIDNPLTVDLYQGSVNIESYLSGGTPYQTMELGQNDYRIANKDVYCYIEGQEEYKRITDGLWHYNKDDAIFFENTTPNGNVEIQFGNNVYGKIPEVDKILNFIYITTEGSAPNDSSRDLTVSLVDINDAVPDRIRNSDSSVVDNTKTILTRSVQGLSVGSFYNGGDEKDKEFYKAVGPGIRAANNRTVTRPDHRALGLDFPNVVDVLFQGQKELNPNKPSWMNVIGVTVLTSTGLPLSDAEWLDYLNYLESIEIWRTDVLRIDPNPVSLNVYGDVFCTRDSELTNVSSFLKFNVAQFFKPQLGSLGKSVYENDVETMFKFKYGNMRVDYVQNVRPLGDTILKTTDFPVLAGFDCSVNYSSRSYNSVPPRIR